MAADPLLEPLIEARNIQHGFGKDVPWRLNNHSIGSNGSCVAQFVFDPSLGPPKSPKTTVWYTVTLNANTLSTALSVVVDESAQGSWKIKPGLHPYFLVRRNHVRIAGLQKGLEYDKGPWEGGDVTYDDNTGR